MISLAADVGGTFTDLVLVNDTTGQIWIEKLPSTPDSTEAIVTGIERLTKQAGIGPRDVDLFFHGFTIATNAWLTRSGAKTVLVTTEGFRDLLEIGTQRRPLAYSLTQRPLRPLVPRSHVVEVTERVDAFGQIVRALTDEEAQRVAAQVLALEPEAIAVSLLFAHLNPAHEEALADAIRRLRPDVPLYLGSRINPQSEEYPRTNTVVTTAYVGPAVDRYVGALERALPRMGMKAPLMLMRSDGGVATARAARENPGAMLLSGPAGGVMAGLEVSRALGIPDLITFDMGGTSADFSLIEDGKARMANERVMEGDILRLPSLDIQTISAGGGSIGSVDLGGAVRVGPESAGSVPGPACYGRGGERPTLTDAALVIGMLSPDAYLGGALHLDLEQARAAVDKHVARPLSIAVHEAAFAMIAIANSHMALTVRRLSVERGYDVRRFSLLSFGGAGSLFAPFLARDLEMREVVIPPRPGVFSAAGLLLSDVRYTYQAPLLASLSDADPNTVRLAFDALIAQAEDRFARDGIDFSRRVLNRHVDVRYSGQVHQLTLPVPTPVDGEAHWRAESIASDFHAQHERAYGFADATMPCEIVNVRLEAIGVLAKPHLVGAPSAARSDASRRNRRSLYLGPKEGEVIAEVWDRDNLSPGMELHGPQIIAQLDTTTLVLPDQRLVVSPEGVLRITNA